MTLEHRTVGDIHVLMPLRRLLGGPETQELVAGADEIATLGTPRIVIDLGYIDFVSSLGLGALVKIHVSCCNRGGWLRIAGVGARIENVLLVTRLIFLFDTFGTVEAAIAGAGSRRPAPHYPATVETTHEPGTVAHGAAGGG